jgi:erythromycin esterase-like protein
VVDFVGWLREHNERPGDERRRTGFYGLDLYSLHRSIEEVLSYLERVDPAAAARACERYSCFDSYEADDGQTYGIAAAFGTGDSCEQQVLDQLVDFIAMRWSTRGGTDWSPTTKLSTPSRTRRR